MNYLIYPFRTMRITQNYLGTTSHLPHTLGQPADYPFDEGGKDTGRDYIYCPCDKMTVKRIYGVGNGGTNTLWLQSDGRVDFADGTRDYFTMLITHPEDSDLRDITVGSSFLRGEKIIREGKDGATAYHLHVSGGKGKYSGNGWAKNTKGKWVLTTAKAAEKPENLFFVDSDFTRVISSAGIVFRTLPKEYTVGKYKVTAELLRIRRSPSTLLPYKKFSELSESAKRKIKALSGGRQADGYVKGLEFTVTRVRGNWGYNNSGWMCLDYCEKIQGGK